MMNKPMPLNSAPSPAESIWSGPERLDSWKEIASYLRREVRTVQLWEKREGLPVHRHFHKRLGSVYALRSEIDSWRRQVTRTGCDLENEAAVAPTAVERITIYVLPFKNVTVKSDRRRLCEEIAVKTTAALEELNPEKLSIISSKPGMHDSGKDLTARIADERVDYVLRWSVQDEGRELRLNTALLFAGSERVAWSHTYRCVPGAFRDLPATAAEHIVQCLWLKLFSSAQAMPVVGQNERSGAREAYLRGRYFWNQRSELSLRKAIGCFESAIHDDPDYALPYTGLADSLTLLSFYEIDLPSEVMPKARQAAQRAIELDPNLAEAHASLADIHLHFDRDWQAADREYRRSIECNPDYALGYHWYANLLSARGQHDAAHMAIMHALEINPVSIITQVWAGVTSHLAHQFDDAIRHYQSALELEPNFVWAHMYLGQALEQKGDLNAALDEFETAVQSTAGNNCVKAMKAHTHALAGDCDTALAIVEELKGVPDAQCTPSYDIAATYAALGDTQQVLSWLNRACGERNMKLFTLTQDPRFDRLRGRAEFRQMIDRMGLSRYSRRHA
jgi:tetratricopeptide (TPR) repeat protein